MIFFRSKCFVNSKYNIEEGKEGGGKREEGRRRKRKEEHCMTTISKAAYSLDKMRPERTGREEHNKNKQLL